MTETELRDITVKPTNLSAPGEEIGTRDLDPPAGKHAMFVIVRSWHMEFVLHDYIIIYVIIMPTKSS